MPFFQDAGLVHQLEILQRDDRLGVVLAEGGEGCELIDNFGGQIGRAGDGVDHNQRAKIFGRKHFAGIGVDRVARKASRQSASSVMPAAMGVAAKLNQMLAAMVQRGMQIESGD